MPAAAIRISALPAPPLNIRPSDGQNYYATVPPASTALTDAQGRYRLANLAPGRYFIIASVFGYPTFYPATTSADGATVITVGADGPVDGINFTVLMPPGGTCQRARRHDRRPPTRRRKRFSRASRSANCSRLRSAQTAHSPSAIFRKARICSVCSRRRQGCRRDPFQVGETDTRVDLVRPTCAASRGASSHSRGCCAAC